MDIQNLYLLNVSEPSLPSRQNLEHTLNIHCGALPLLPWWLLKVTFHLYSYMVSKPHVHIQYIMTGAPISSTATLLSQAATVSGQEPTTAKRFQPDRTRWPELGLLAQMLDEPAVR